MGDAVGLPTGPAVTFLFTDIEGSTRLERAVGSAAWAAQVARHDALLRGAIEGAGGTVVKTEGDAFFAAFPDAGAATRAAVAAQRSLAAEAWPADGPVRVRMGLHTGEGRLRHGRPGDPADYVGIDVNYAARVAAAGNGGQVVLSDALVQAIGDLAIDDAELADEGLRALKDFEEPLRLHRLVIPGVADDTRPLRTLEPPTNLPGEATPLVGRETEIERLSEILGANRIVTLTGPGGSGKTRLALGLAQSVRRRFPHGTWFVDLAAVREPALLESAIASTLDLRESAERSMADALREHLRGRTSLLVLDNLEQLLPECAEIVAALARAAPDVRLVVTSRELLRIAGERGHPVPPLDLDAGIELFEARALAIRPDLVLGEDTRRSIREICERLFGLPLAIELAAARTRLLSPGLILDRLSSSLDLAGGSRDVPERQRTLRGAMAWSHDLLSEAERRLFRRLAVFAGGWTAELAYQVVDAERDLGVDVLEGIESLADKSLVRIEAAGSDGGEGAGAVATDEPRFDMHPLLREYARERLDESGEGAGVEARHAAAIASMAEALGDQILAPGGAGAVRRLDREQHNVRAAIDWALRTGETAIGLRAMTPIWRWYQQRGLLREARATLSRLTERAPDDIRLRIAALSTEGALAYWADDFEGARRTYEARLALAEESGDPRLRAEAYYDLGFLSMVFEEPERLRQQEQQALALYEEIADTNGALRARQALVLAEFLGGDYERALELESENLAALRAAGSDFQIADSMTFHAGVFLMAGDPARSWAFVTDSLRWFADNDNSSGIVRALGMAAIIILTHGDAEVGARVAGATYQLMREKGVMLAPVKVLHLREPEELAVERLGRERATELLAEGAASPIRQVVDEVLDAPPPTGPAMSAPRR